MAALAAAQLKLPGVKLPGGSDPLNKDPVTTSLKDAKWEAKDQDGFTPREPLRSLMTLQRTPTGGFTLQPGYYEITLQSY
jgi:hypothetical protein